MNPVSPTAIRNKYDYLKLDGANPHDIPVEAASSWTLTDSRRETVTISNALLPDGSWVYGYAVYWAGGATSVKEPSPSLGQFRSQREAKLHAVGFFSHTYPTSFRRHRRPSATPRPPLSRHHCFNLSKMKDLFKKYRQFVQDGFSLNDVDDVEYEDVQPETFTFHGWVTKDFPDDSVEFHLHKPYKKKSPRIMMRFG